MEKRIDLKNVPDTKMKVFFSPSLKEEKGYIESVHYNLTNGYAIICHIFKDWEYLELIIESPRGGSVFVNMNIDNAVSIFAEALRSISEKINVTKSENK